MPNGTSFDCSVAVSSWSSAELCEEINFTGSFLRRSSNVKIWIRKLCFMYATLTLYVYKYIWYMVQIYPNASITSRQVPRSRQTSICWTTELAANLLKFDFLHLYFQMDFFAVARGFLKSIWPPWLAERKTLLRNLSALHWWRYHSWAYCIWP